MRAREPMTGRCRAATAAARAAWLGVGVCIGGIGAASAEVAGFRVVADAIPVALAGSPGDAARGRRIVLDRTVGNCLICHAVPEPQERFMGDIGPDLSGVGSRLTAAQLRLRVVDAARLNPQTVMPPYHRIAGLSRVGAPWRGRSVLTAEQVEDVVAYLVSLGDAAPSGERAR